MSLKEVLHRYLKAGTQGQLVLKFSDEEHLCKISIEDGNAVYLSLGKIGPEETLNSLGGKQVEWANFIEGMPSRKRLPQSLNKPLMEIALGIQPTVSPQALQRTHLPIKSGRLDLSSGAPAETVDAIIEAFVDLIGPLGTILAEKAAQDLGYREGGRMEPSVLARFVSILADEIPEDERRAFLDKFGP